MIAITPDLLTHVKLIDDQHAQLINLINEVEALDSASNTEEGAEKALKFLGDYITMHFSQEERLMQESGYPTYQWHSTWHQGYITKFNNLYDEYKENGPSEEFLHILHEFIIKWIVTHIKNVDVDLGKHINAQKK